MVERDGESGRWWRETERAGGGGERRGEREVVEREKEALKKDVLGSGGGGRPVNHEGQLREKHESSNLNFKV